ncbi:YjbE family integral membrane protein [Humitalea rosea]|uniref:YjbE family integral membrane protein n=1 Tax=Humitalea rosea TaxID=990373 RepID=A0A2W7IN74_9PROT|nr:YjbE family putative metal transport protein [Humitalea rosea]PZW40817.1 YjbE family integral membrane protein [Humitalea rosea]
MEALSAALPGLMQIIWLNAILSGDNAVVIGLAAAGLPAAQRGKAVLFGVAAAAVLRVVFSIFATKLLELWWIDLVGGLALIWIAYGFAKELLEGGHDSGEPGSVVKHDKTLAQALRQIVIADVSMSLDNVLAVAAVARGNIPLLTIGLGISIIMMGLLGGALANLLQRFRWIAWVGLALIIWIAGGLLWEGLLNANAELALGLPVPAVTHH